MNRKQKAAFCLVLIAIVIIGVVISVDANRIDDYLEQKIVATLRDGGINSKFTGFERRDLGAYTEKAEIFLPTRFLFFVWNFEEVLVQVKWLSVGRLVPAFGFRANSYQGNIEGEGEFEVRSERLRAAIRGENIALGEHPQIRALGIVSADLNFATRQLSLEKGRLSEAAIHLELKRINIPEETTLLPQITGLPLALTIPPITQGTISVEADVRGSHIHLHRFIFKSSLGQLSGKGLFTDPGGSSGIIDLELGVELSSVGEHWLGAMLPLISGNALSASDKEFSLLLKGPSNRPELVFQRVK